MATPSRALTTPEVKSLNRHTAAYALKLLAQYSAFYIRLTYAVADTANEWPYIVKGGILASALLVISVFPAAGKFFIVVCSARSCNNRSIS